MYGVQRYYETDESCDPVGKKRLFFTLDEARNFALKEMEENNTLSLITGVGVHEWIDEIICLATM